MIKREGLWAWVLLAAAGCDVAPAEENPGSIRVEDVATDAEPDVDDLDAQDDAAEDASEDSPDNPDVPRQEPGSRVELDLSPWTQGGGQGQARLFQAANEGDLIGGEAAQGKVGDWVLENARARFVVEGDDRVIGPCPWGGNIIDAGARVGEGWAPDVVGELCLFLNIGRTLDPERYEVLADGSDGGAAILAVTGRAELLDFLAIKAMAAGLSGGLELPFPVDPDAELPITITIYYILRPGDQGVQVVSAFRNDGEAQTAFAVSHLADSGGSVAFFNPLNEYGGFGYKSLGADNLRSTPLPLLAFQSDEGGWAYVPQTAGHIAPQQGLPLAGSYVSIAGVAVSWLGTSDILAGLLTPQASFPNLPGVLKLQPGEVGARPHWIMAGDGSLSTMLDSAYPALGVETGRARGVVRDARGEPVQGARVSLVSAEGDTFNQAVTDAGGAWGASVPAGTWSVRARFEGREVTQEGLEVVAGQEAVQDVAMPDPGRVRLRVRQPDGTPTPARVTISCEGECVERPTAQLVDSEGDAPGAGSVWAVEFVGVSGELEVPLPPGTYRVAVSRGMEWSMWPADAPQTRGMLVELEAGQEVNFEAQIAQVVDTRGVLSGDFHVHSVDSPDSPVRHRDRVLGFMADGVDVLVSTDHDRVADLRPTIEELGAQEEIVNLMGVELTTSHYGHYNSFPQVKDPNSRNGGAVDWAGGAGPGLKPAEIFAGLRAAPGEQVVQVNHPSDAFGGIKADLVRGISLGDPAALRIAPSEPDPVTGDTGLFSEDFTAMEVMNGLSLPKMWGYWRWWLQMIGRGFTPTGTAVTDTHRLRRQENGTPRTYVFLPEGKDTLENFDAETFAVAVNQHRAIGTNGPFFRVSVTGAEGQAGTLGDTVAANAGRVQVRVEYDVPEWVVVNRVDVFTNLRDPILTEVGQRIEDEVPPSRSIEFEPAAPTEAVEGAVGHRHRAGVVEFELETPQDAYVILVLRGVGDGVPGMFPAIFDGRVKPFAFANPFFVDADGGGYNNPPLADLARMPSEKPRPVTPVRERKALLEALIEHYGHTDH